LGYWGFVIPVCNIHVDVYEGIYVLYSLALRFPCLSLPFSWLILALFWINPRLLLFLSFGLLKVKWVHTFYLVPNHSFTVFCLSFTVLYVTFKSLTLFGCGGRVQVFHSSFPSLYLRGRAFRKEQHIRMLRMHLCMSIKPPHGEKLSIYLMKLLTIYSKDRFEIFVYWAPPFLLLSLFLINMYAQNHELLCPYSCWHLLIFQNVGDEVRGKYPLAYEDMFSEARSSSFLVFVQQQVIRYTYFY